MVLAQFGVFMAFITPIAISLAVRLGELAPANQEYLGYITGAGALWVMLTAPFMGIWSDRTRTRIGRRRPFMIGGMIVGVLSLFVMALAPSVLLLGAGWILAQWGWGTVLGNLQNSTADRLPESQRGKVAGLTGFATQVAPVIGVIATMGLTGNALLLFLVPGVVGVVLVTLFVTLVHEDDSRGLPLERIGAAGVLRKYVYNPRKYPDFSWNWLARFFFYFGLTLNTTFTAFFFADRLGVSITEVSGVIGTLGGIGVLATTAGAIGGGFLSDRFRRRKVFLVLGGAIMAVGMVTMALSIGPAVPLRRVTDRFTRHRARSPRWTWPSSWTCCPRSRPTPDASWASPVSPPPSRRPPRRSSPPASSSSGSPVRTRTTRCSSSSPRPSCSSAGSSSFASARSADPARQENLTCHRVIPADSSLPPRPPEPRTNRPRTCGVSSASSTCQRARPSASRRSVLSKPT